MRYVYLTVDYQSVTEGECKCQNQRATKLPWLPDGVLNGSQLPIGDQNEPFWTPLGPLAMAI